MTCLKLNQLIGDSDQETSDKIQVLFHTMPVGTCMS